MPTTSESEVWLEHPEKPGLFISNAGRAYNARTGRQLKGSLDEGYVSLKYDNRTLKMHRLVARTFLGQRPEGLVIRHLNDIKNDNRIENLVYGTVKENVHDSIRNGTARYLTGSEHGMAKLNDAQVLQIRAWLSYGFHKAEIARWFSVNKSTIGNIASGKTWKKLQ